MSHKTFDKAKFKNKEEFMKIFYLYVDMEVVRYYYKDTTYTVYFMRSNGVANLKINEFILNPTEIFYNTSTEMNGKMPNEILKDILENHEVLFKVEDNELSLFNCSSYYKGLMNRNRESITVSCKDYENLYYTHFMLDNVKKKTIRFYPKESERELFHSLLTSRTNKLDYLIFHFGKINLLTLDSCIKRYSKIQNLVASYYNTTFVEVHNQDNKNAIYDITDLDTMVTSWKDEKMTPERMSMWCRARHDVLAANVMNALDMKVTKTDVSMLEHFGYNEFDWKKTPDICYEKDDKIYILEVAVTKASESYIRMKKIKYYSKMVVGLESFTGKDVIMDSLVWNISTNNFQVPDFLEEVFEDIKNSDVVKTLLILNEKLNDFLHYSELTKMAEDIEEDTDEMTQWETKSLEIMVQEICNMDEYTEKLSIDIGHSRNKVEKKEFKLLKDMEFFKEMSWNINNRNKNYMQDLIDTFSNMINKKKVPKHMEIVLEFNVPKLDNLIEKEMDKANDVFKNSVKSFHKFPKIFKFPIFKFSKADRDASDDCMESNMFLGFDRMTDDGTIFTSKSYLNDDDNDKIDEDNYNHEGMGFNQEITEEVEGVLEMLWEDDDNIEDSYLMDDIIKNNEAYDKIKKKRIWNILYGTTDFFYNMALLEGRRHIFNGSKGHTVYKDFGAYTMAIHKGSKLTAQKQIRVKIFVKKKNLYNGRLMSNMFHSWKDCSEYEEWCETEWLTYSITDIKHFVKLKETAIALASDFQDKLAEMKRLNLSDIDFNSMSLKYMLLVLMEHKRGTSTSSQLNRYIMHSMTSFISNKEKMIKDVIKEPTRSYVEAAIKFKQLMWMRAILPNLTRMWKTRILDMHSTATQYDRILLPSFFNNTEMVEFSIMMNEIYLGNLFEKESGFVSHRLKPIVIKMSEAEMNFMKVRETPESVGNVDSIEDFVMKPDTLHTFDKEFVMDATDKFFSDSNNKNKVNLAITKAMSATVDNAMMMTSSLIAGPYSSPVLEYRSNILKSKSFLTIFDQIDHMDTHILSEMVKNDKHIEAVFAMFPKSQIGGPREILIQSVKCRLMVKFLETVSRELCSIHPKEMLTKADEKSELQSKVMSSMKTELTRLRKNKKPSMLVSFNMDESRWAPGFVMENFLYFINMWDIPTKLKQLLLSIVNSFSHKTHLVPNELAEKWDNKPRNKTEYLEEAEYFRNRYYEDGVGVDFFSGMGQGMLHYLSSFYHCVMDDYFDEVSEVILKTKFKTTVVSKTLISSDDKTKMILFQFDKPELFKEALDAYTVMIDNTNRLANMHVNWKKSGMSFYITEFNSLFSIGKRMCYASIKDLYNANAIPDLTNPEEAVKYMLSNIRRAFEHGVYLTTINLMLLMARQQLKDYYRFDKRLMQDIMSKLDINNENMLPYNLGFIPLDMPIETLLYGPEIHMYNKNNSETLDDYYTKLYTASTTDREKLTKGAVPFSESSSGKFWIELKSELDKRLKEMKDEYYESRIKMKPDEVMRLVNKNALNINQRYTDMNRHYNYQLSYFIGMNRRYAFQETMVVHSLVRALQFSRCKCVLYPKAIDHELTEKEMKKMQKRMRTEIMTKDERMAVFDEFQELENRVEEDNMDIEKFVDFILARSSERSSRFMLDGLKVVVKSHYENMEKMMEMSVSHKYTHPTMRNIRFYSNDVSLNTKKDDILNYMFSPSKDVRNSVIMLFGQIVDNADLMSIKEVLKNPFKFVKSFMKNSDYPYKSFVDYLDFNNKALMFLKVNMMADFEDSGNMKTNILNLYRTKMTPEGVYEKDGEYEVSDLELKFLSNISMDGNAFSRERVPDDDMVAVGDNPLTRLMKLDSFLHFNKNDSLEKDTLMTDMIKYRRVEYSRKTDSDGVVTKRWTNLDVIIEAIESKEEVKNPKKYTLSVLKKPKKVIRKLFVSIVANKHLINLDYTTNIFSVFDRYLIEMEGKNYIIDWKTKEYHSKSKDYWYDIKDIYYKIEYRMDALRWTSNLKLFYQVERVFETEVENEPEILIEDNEVTFFLYSDRYTMDSNLMRNYVMDINEDGLGKSFNDMLLDPPSILTLDRFFMSKGWLESNFLIVKEKRKEKKNILSSYSMGYGSASFAEAMSTLMDMKSMNMLGPEVESVTDDSPVTMQFMNNPTINHDMVSMFDALKSYDEEKARQELENVDVYSRSSVMSMMDKVCNLAFNNEFTIDKERLRNTYDNYKEKDEKVTQFLNVLLHNIFDLFDYNLSDSMGVMLLLFVLRSNTRNASIRLNENLVRMNFYARNQMKNNPKFANDSWKFIRRREETMNTYEEMMEFMEDMEDEQ